MNRFSREFVKRINFAFRLPFQRGATLKGKEFAPFGANSLKEQILSLKNRPYLRKEAMSHLQKLFPLVKMVEWEADLYHIRMILLGSIHIQLNISKMLASTKY